MIQSARVEPVGARLVDAWLIRVGAVGWRLLVTMALGLVLIWIVRVVSTVSAAILIAAIVAATFAPFVFALRARGWSPVKAAAVVFVGAAVIILATLAVIAIAFLPAVSSMLGQLGAGLAALQRDLAGRGVPPEVGISIDQTTTGAEVWLSASVSEVIGSVASGGRWGCLRRS